MGYCICRDKQPLAQNNEISVDIINHLDSTKIGPNIILNSHSVKSNKLSKGKFKVKESKKQLNRFSLSILHSQDTPEKLFTKETNSFSLFRRVKTWKKYSTEAKSIELCKDERKRRFSDTTIPIMHVNENIFENTNNISIIILGGKGVGKSSFVIKLTRNYFEKLYIPTLRVETFSKKLSYQGKSYKFNFIITPGDNNYKEDITSLFQKVNFTFIFYDTSSKGSFEEAKEILKKEVKNHAWIFKNKITNFYFVGNKIDIKPRIESYDEVESYCHKHNYEFFEISVKDGIGVKAFINNIIEKYNEIVYYS